MQSDNKRLSTISSASRDIDIGYLLKKYKQTNTKLSPLPLSSFQKVALDENLQLLQQLPDCEITSFLGFKELNQGAVGELKRSLLQSKQSWNNYSQSLFTEESYNSPNQSRYYTSRKLQLHHNKNTFEKIKQKYKKQEEQQLEEVRKSFVKIQYHSPGIKAYPSMQYQDLQRMEQIRRQIRYGHQSEQMSNKDAQLLTNKLNESLLNEMKTKKQIVYISVNNDQTQWTPCSRIGSSMITYDHKIYLYGGSGSNPFEDCNQLQIDKYSYKWNPIKISQTNGYRVNHSAGLYKNLMLIFGGEVHTQSIKEKICEISCDIKLLNLNTLEFKIMKQTGIIPPRKCHICEIIGKSMIIHGGIDIKGTFLRDATSYDMISQRWNPLLYEQHSCYPNGIAYHKSCQIFHNSNMELYKNDPDVRFGNQGIYIFGGLDKKNNYLNCLVRMDISTKPITYEIIGTKGIPPSICLNYFQVGRCQHSMNYIEKLQLIVIYGGKNDDLYENGFLNDINVLEAKTMTWINVDSKGQVIDGRCGHSASSIDTKLYIFGGYNYSGFVKTDLIEVELDSIQAAQLASEEIVIVKPRISKLSTKINKIVKKDKLQQIKEQIQLICPPKKNFLPIPRRLSDLLSQVNLNQIVQTINENQTKENTSRSTERNSKRTLTLLT